MDKQKLTMYTVEECERHIEKLNSIHTAQMAEMTRLQVMAPMSAAVIAEQYRYKLKDLECRLHWWGEKLWELTT